MSEAQPDPARPQAQSSPQAASRPDAAVPAGADSYTEMPAAPAPKRRWGIWGACAVALALGGAFAAKQYAPVPAPAAAVAEQNLLLVSAADLNRKGTDAVRALPGSKLGPQTMLVYHDDQYAATYVDGKLVHSAPGYPSPAPDLSMPAAPAKQAAAAPAPAGSPKPIALPELAAPLAPEAAAAVRSGEFALFTLRLIDYAAMDGDIIAVSVDGVPMGQFTITHGGATLDIPLKPGRRQVVRLTGVHDGGGGITLGMQSSLGQISTRDLAPGESVEWVVDYR